MAIHKTDTTPVAVCHADGWLQQVHARAVDRLTSADYRHQLLHCRLQMADVAGWPSLELVDPLAEPTTELLAAYRRALADVLHQAAEALLAGSPPAPEPDGGGLRGLWRQVMGRMRGSVGTLALWDAALVSLTADAAVIELPRAGRIPYLKPHLPELHDAVALVVGQRVKVEVVAAGNTGEG